MTSPVPDIVDAVVAGRSIVRTLVPLLLAQLALLAVTVLGLMAHATVGAAPARDRPCAVARAQS